MPVAFEELQETKEDALGLVVCGVRSEGVRGEKCEVEKVRLCCGVYFLLLHFLLPIFST